MKGLAIAKDLTLPLDAVTQKFAFLGRTGSGKTYGATKLAEEMLDAGAQVVALDPVGVWYGLRLAANGKDPGIEIPVFGGLHGDIPLEPTAGALLADLIVDRGISAILDVSQFESDTDKARFARDFAARFFFRKKAAPSAVHIFVEECQEFVPQNPQRGDEQMLHAFHRLIKLGRNFGIGLSLISQRPQEVNKKALNQTECMFAFQMTGPQERKAISLWVSEKGADEDVADVLPKLAIGEPHVWSPQWLQISRTVKIAAKRTFNASSTPTVGGKAVEARPLGSIDLEKLQKAMVSTIEKAKADDPKHLKSEILRLKRELEGAGKKNGNGHSTVKEKLVIDSAAIDKAVARAMADIRKKIVSEATQVRRILTRINASFREVPDLLDSAIARLDIDFIETGNATHSVASVAARPLTAERSTERVASTGGEIVRRATPEPRQSPSTAAGEVSGAQQKIVDAIAMLNGLGIPEPSIVQVALFVGISHTTGSYLQNLRDLETWGVVTRGKGTVTLTSSAYVSPNLDFSREPIDFWYEKLPGAQSRLLKVIVGRFPKGVSKEDLAAEVGISYTTGSYLQNLRDMRDLGIIELGRGDAIASELLFP